MENLKNPFIPPEKRAQKRLFINNEPVKSLNERTVRRLREKEKLIKYGMWEIKEKQVDFLLAIEKQLVEMMREQGEHDYTLEQAHQRMIDPTEYSHEVDEEGNLRVIDLHNLFLQKIPNLRAVKYLHKLNCSHCSLTELAGLGFLNELEVLRCEGNNLISLPGLDRLRKLQWLSCQKNKLRHLPNLSLLKDLEGVDLTRNSFSKEEKEKIIEQLPAVYDIGI